MQDVAYNHGEAVGEIGIERAPDMGSKAKLVVLPVELTILDGVPEEGSVNIFFDKSFAIAPVYLGILIHGPPVGLAVCKKALCDPAGQGIT